MATSNIILSLINEVAIYFLVFLFIFTLKGFGMALFARALGDHTMEEEGFLTLNPLAHVNVLGLALLLLVLSLVEVLFGGGLFRGAAYLFLIALGVYCTFQGQVDRYNFKNMRVGTIVFAFSKSIVFFVIAFLAMIFLKLVMTKFLPAFAVITMATFFTTVINITLFWCVAELLPIPPFEVGCALRYIVPQRFMHIVDFLEEYSLFIIMFLLFAPGISDVFFSGIWSIASGIKQLMARLLF